MDRGIKEMNNTNNYVELGKVPVRIKFNDAVNRKSEDRVIEVKKKEMRRKNFLVYASGLLLREGLGRPITTCMLMRTIDSIKKGGLPYLIDPSNDTIEVFPYLRKFKDKFSHVIEIADRTPKKRLSTLTNVLRYFIGAEGDPSNIVSIGEDEDGSFLLTLYELHLRHCDIFVNALFELSQDNCLLLTVINKNITKQDYSNIVKKNIYLEGLTD